MSLLSNCLLTLSLPKCTVLKNTDYSDANKPVAPLDFAEQSDLAQLIHMCLIFFLFKRLKSQDPLLCYCKFI